MPEAPPHRPGHVGHTPQEVGPALERARRLGALTATVARFEPQAFASQAFEVPVVGRRAGFSSTLAQIDQFALRRRLVSPVEPLPIEFRDGFYPEFSQR